MTKRWFTEPQQARQAVSVKAKKAGTVKEIDNRRLARVAKLAGAPRDVTAGGRLRVGLNQQVTKGEILYTVRATSNRFRPRVYSRGPHTVKLGKDKPDGPVLRSLTPGAKEEDKVIEVSL